MKRIIAIGGGSLKEKTTIEIDKYIATLAKERANGKRAYGLFIGTASHDFMPAFNSFRKTYTSLFDIKADVVLTINTQMDEEKINEKFLKADFIYIGGGDTLFMLDRWQKDELLNKIIDAYKRGVIIAGSSAGAVCWFETMYTDSETVNKSGEYSICKGLGVLKGVCSPHYNIRKNDLQKAIIDNNIDKVYAIEDDSALEFIDGKLVKSISSGGNSYIVTNNGELVEQLI